MARIGSKGFLDNLGKIYAIYTGGFIAFVILPRHCESDVRHVDQDDRLAVHGRDHRPLCHHRHLVAYGKGLGVLCCRTFGPGVLQRHGNGLGLDVRGLVHRHGRHHLRLGYDGLAYIMGWTGGYVLLAVFLGPYLRKFGQYTIPDFLGARYGGHAARSIGIIAAITASFTYLIAQVTGVGIIMSRFLNLDFPPACSWASAASWSAPCSAA